MTLDGHDPKIGLEDGAAIRYYVSHALGMLFTIAMGMPMDVEMTLTKHNTKSTTESAIPILRSLADCKGTIPRESLQQYVLQLRVQMTPADDFDISRQFTRFRLLVCAASDQQDFTSGPEDGF